MIHASLTAEFLKYILFLILNNIEPLVPYSYLEVFGEKINYILDKEIAWGLLSTSLV